MSKASPQGPRKGPPPPAEMAESYEAMAMDLLADAQAKREIGEAMQKSEPGSRDADGMIVKAQRLREEAAVSAQIATSLRLRVLDEPKTELAVVDERDAAP